MKVTERQTYRQWNANINTIGEIACQQCRLKINFKIKFQALNYIITSQLETK